MAHPLTSRDFPDTHSQERLEPQEKLQAVGEDSARLFMGLPKEETMKENRVALVPSSVSALVGAGHRIVVESGAGEKSHFSDHDFSEAGAQIVHSKKEVYEAEIVLKVAPPNMEETQWLRPGQIIISPLQIPMLSKELLLKLKDKRVIAVAMEYLQDQDGSFPLVRMMSEMAGYSAILKAAELLTISSGGKGVLLGGISGVPPAKIVILGAGVVGEFAVRSALGLGAEVCVFDNNIYKLMRIQNRLGRQLFTSALNTVALEKELMDADVVIGAIHSESGRSPIIVTEEMVMKMPPGAVIIDVSIDQGGCVETSELTVQDRPTFVKHEVIHYCVPNIASNVARTASMAGSNILTPILLQAGETKNIEQLLYQNQGLRHGVYMYKGALTNTYLGEQFDIKYTNLDLLITSNL
jgi:alanine dehydrogenase